MIYTLNLLDCLDIQGIPEKKHLLYLLNISGSEKKISKPFLSKHNHNSTQLNSTQLKATLPNMGNLASQTNIDTSRHARNLKFGTDTH